jgi:hypothetical protein
MPLPQPRTVYDAMLMMGAAVKRAPPDRRRATESYGAMAPQYEVRTLSGDPWRQKLVG